MSEFPEDFKESLFLHTIQVWLALFWKFESSCLSQPYLDAVSVASVPEKVAFHFGLNWSAGVPSIKECFFFSACICQESFLIELDSL